MLWPWESSASSSKVKVRRARSAFSIFKGEAYSIIKTDNPDFTLGQIASETLKRWRALTDEQEKPYYDLAAEELILYPHVKSVEQLEAKEQRKQARLANLALLRKKKEDAAESRRAEWRASIKRREDATSVASSASASSASASSAASAAASSASASSAAAMGFLLESVAFVPILRDPASYSAASSASANYKSAIRSSSRWVKRKRNPDPDPNGVKRKRAPAPKKHKWWLRRKSSIPKEHRFRLAMSRNNTSGYRGIEATLLFYFVVYFI